MEMLKYEKSYAVRICRKCDKWYKPTSKHQKHCELCKNHNRVKYPHKKLTQSMKLAKFYEKYNLK